MLGNILKLSSLLSLQRKKAIGIAALSEGWSVVELVREGKSYAVTKYSTYKAATEQQGTYVAQEALVAELYQKLQQDGYTAQVCAYSIGGRYSYLQEITLPTMPSEEIAEAVLWDSTQYVPYEQDTYYVGYTACGNKDGQQHLALCATPKEVVDALCAASQEQTPAVAIVEPQAASWGRLCGGEVADYLLLVMEFGSTLLTFYHAGVPVAERSLPQGVRDLVSIVAEQGEVSMQEALILLKEEDLFAAEDLSFQQDLVRASDDLAGECGKALSYYALKAPERSFQQVVLAGEGANICGLSAALERELKLTVTPYVPQVELTFPEQEDNADEQSLRREYAVAIGAALGALGNSELNLLPHQAQKRRYNLAHISACVALVAVVGTILAYAGIYLRFTATREALRTVRHEVAELGAWPVRYKEDKKMAAQLKNLTSLINSLEAQQRPLNLVIRDLAERISEGSYLTQVTQTGAKIQAVQIMGRSIQMDDFLHFVHKLEASPVVRSVTITGTKAIATLPQAVDFSLRLELKGGEKGAK